MTRTLKRTWIARCPGCKAHRRLEAGSEIAAVEFNFAYKTPIPVCACGRVMAAKTLKGSVSDHKCGARCLASKGHVCECSCGGKNHGAAA